MNMDEREIATHAGHCCVLHGCKYGEETCPVEHGKTKQYYPCQDCDSEADAPLYGAHPTHCCSRHGCRYPYKGEECPVVVGTVVQQYPCDYCVNVKEAEEEITELQAEIAFVKKVKEDAKKAEENKKSRKKYRVKMTTRSARVLDELLKEHQNDPRHKCDHCDGDFFISDENTDSPFANDRAYNTNSVNTVSFRPDPFRSEIRGDDTKQWICNQCWRSSADEI